jgi:glycogen debranching enzyme
LLFADHNGDLHPAGGFYFHRTRFLSRMHMLVNGDEPETISAHPVDANSWAVYRLAHLPPSPDGSGLVGTETAKKAIVIATNIRVDEGVHYEFQFTNRAVRPVSITVTCELAADFADMNEAKSGRREQSAPIECEWHPTGGGGRLTFRYVHPRLHHATTIEFTGTGLTRAGTAVRCSLALQPHQCRRVSAAVDARFNATGIRPPAIASGPGGERWTEQCASLHTGNQIVQTAWNRAVSDLSALCLHEGEAEERFVFAAGVPNYLGLFGRDSLMAGLQSALLNPMPLRGALRLLGRTIACAYDDRYDAQPGRVLHQRVLSPLAILGKTPFLHYYGDFSAPGLFLLGVAWDLAQTGDLAFFRSMGAQVSSVLTWMERDGDADGDGFYEYQTRAGKQGLKNQGWKDSEEAILHPDGRIVANPIAVAEIQGLYCAAKQALALAFAAAGDHVRARGLLEEAAALKRRFNQRFWMAEEQYTALALGPDKKPVRSVASDAGECLAYGIVDDDKAGAVIERLMAPDMFSGWASAPYRTCTQRTIHSVTI